MYRTTRSRALNPLECAVEHPTKDASPEGVSRPKDLSRTLSPLQCAVPQFCALSPLECAVTKSASCNSFRMRSYKKRWGGGGYRVGYGPGGFLTKQTGRIPDAVSYLHLRLPALRLAPAG